MSAKEVQDAIVNDKDSILIKCPNGKSRDTETRKLVLFFGWLNATSGALQRHFNLYFDLNYDVLFIPGRFKAFAWPPISMKLATHVLNRTSDLMENYPYFFCHAVSIGAYNFTSCLMKIYENQPKFQLFLNKLKGVVFDSLTIGSIERMKLGISNGFPQDSFLRPLIPLIFSGYLFFTRKYTRDFYEKGVRLFSEKPIRVPTLVIYSRDDPMCDAEHVDQLIKSWRESFPVYFACWAKSKHTMHIREHREEYMETFRNFMSHVCGNINTKELYNDQKSKL